nr:immunoglobulin light chain junction region [Macaca mulatta]MOY05535.1 immunoglobulin light chain junction region [Macaca mulatta]MOY05933.1 immunoglobulin light chain junction region [Macaca mulatta]MOY06714.1 immunoglobulin light chain junction region [Macaca mulatta]MOY07098.1 immunoglobulin light chain junction region [Macaca mulatta]
DYYCQVWDSTGDRDHWVF